MNQVAMRIISAISQERGRWRKRRSHANKSAQKLIKELKVKKLLETIETMICFDDSTQTALILPR